MSLVAASSSSSAQTLHKKYDVFISFRGEDTRCNFTSHLDDAFHRRHIKAYIDYQLHPGDEISPSLLKAIADSYISVVVFSENYASSRWCLDELTHILQCKRVQRQVVVPIFYKVEPSHVRHQTGPYKQAFERYERDPMVAQHKMQMWKQALKDAADVAGYDSWSNTFRDEAEMIRKIVKDILQKLYQKYPPPKLEGLVGIDDTCAEIELLLTDAETIGIWGMGGIGKSTIAKTIFYKYSSHYERSCFLENVRERSQNGLAELRRNFLSCLLEEDICIDTLSTFLKSRLRLMEVFIVLDDVSTVDQLEGLVGKHHCFGPGSKILITTRDKHLLISERVDVIHQVKKLEKDHAYRLFNLNAFKTDYPIARYKELVQRAIVYASGIPLALKVLGLYLRGRSEVVWESAMRKLEKSPHEDIQKVLRLSYDGLDREEKKIFLEIACFLKGELTEFVISLLDSFGFSGALGISTLQDKALIHLDDGKCVEMHDLIQEMGLQIVREESIDKPERRSRLWDSQEIYNVLVNNVRSKKVEGIKLNVSQIEDIHLKADIFKKMPNVRYLRFYSPSYNGSSHVHLPKGLKYCPNKTRYLEWYGFPLKSLPSTFRPEKLVKLCMLDSHLQKLWDGVQDFASLEEIDLSGSTQLEEMPNLSKCLNLKVVRLSCCESLCDVHSSILSLHSLVELDLLECKKLKSLKSVHLRSLQKITVRGCRNLKEFSVSSGELRELSLSLTGIGILHSSVARSSKLEVLKLNELRLVDLPNQLSCLTNLTLLQLYKCEFIDDLKLHILFDGMLSLEGVGLGDCCNITELPNNTKHILRLESLYVSNCRRLRSLPELPPSLSSLHADNCKSLEIAPSCGPLSEGTKHFSFLNCVQLNEQSLHNVMETAYSIISSVWHKNADGIYASSIHVPGSKVPKWFKYRGAQSSVIVELPQNSELAALFLCTAICVSSEIESHFILNCACYLDGLKVASSELTVYGREMKSDHVFIWNGRWVYENRMHETRRGKVQLSTNRKRCYQFTVRNDVFCEFRECGVHPVYVSESQKFVERMEMERKKNRRQDVEEQQPLPQFKKFEFDEMDTLL